MDDPLERLGPPSRQRVVDLRLVLAAREGSGHAFDTLVDRYYAEISAYLKRLVRDPELAADLTQETFFAAYHSLHQLDDDQSFAAWLYRIALFRATPVFRRRKLVRFVPFDSLSEWVAGRVGGRGIDPAEREWDELVQAALDWLPDEHRAVLLLHTVGGFPAVEIASILGKREDTVTRQVSRARQQFREVYEAMAAAESGNRASLERTDEVD